MGITGKLHEAKSTKSYDSFEIISRFATPSSFKKIVESVKEVSLLHFLHEFCHQHHFTDISIHLAVRLRYSRTVLNCDNGLVHRGTIWLIDLQRLFLSLCRKACPFFSLQGINLYRRSGVTDSAIRLAVHSPSLHNCGYRSENLYHFKH